MLKPARLAIALHQAGLLRTGPSLEIPLLAHQLSLYPL